MVAISAREWDGVDSRPHHFMRRCARSGWHVLFVEPPASLLAPLKSRARFTRWRNWGRGLRSVEPGVSVLAPPPVLPFGSKWRWINRVNQRWIARSLRAALRRLRADAPDLYVLLPGSIDLVPHLDCRLLIYDCVDDHAAFTGWIDSHTVRRMERELMRRADVCFASARALFEQRKSWSVRLQLIPNGCDYERFARAAVEDAPTSLLDEIGTDSGRRLTAIAGFVGGLGDWVDLDLLAALAPRLPEIAFVFIGPAMVDVGRLAALPNVRFLGARPYRELPALVRQFAVGLIPFHRNELTAAVNPIKLFEYLAAGIPVVSTPLPEVLPFANVVAIATDTDGFVTAIHRAIEGGSDRAAVRDRRAVAAQSSWDSRWQQVLESIAAIDRE